MLEDGIDPDVWEDLRVKDLAGYDLWRCKVCDRSIKHQAQLEIIQRARLETEVEHTDSSKPTTSTSVSGAETSQQIVQSALTALLASMSGEAPGPETASEMNSGFDLPRTPSPVLPIVNWNLIAAGGDTELDATPASAEDEAVQELARALQVHMGTDWLSDDEDVERDDVEDQEVPEPTVSGNDYDANRGGRTRARTRDHAEFSRIWYPWHDKITCTLDILMHLPRSVFSQRQLDLFLWLLKINDVDDVPSVRSMQQLNARLQRMCGIDTIQYQGALGHTYHVNDLRQIISQEMANPKVRPHLHFYPEDTRGAKLDEGRQGSRWLDEMPDECLTPMARFGVQDYFIHEPALLRTGHVVMPYRWFTRMEEGKNQIYAKCWQMQPVANDTGRGWRVVKRSGLEIRQELFLQTFPELLRDHALFDLPSPANIFDVLDFATGENSAWDCTDPAIGNRWRALAKGNRVMGFGLWYYCDDTSGNMSKKWNEHNSVLVTPAGLPRHEAQKEYNVHFLCTSNLAPPLEMMDGVVEQLEQAQDEGVWAWDCELNEPVLLVPFVLALLGDNPMQSEFACHIGLRGKFFCRNCWVKGHDAADRDNIPSESEPAASAAASTADHDNVIRESESVAGSSDNESVRSADSNASGKTRKAKGKGKKVIESMSAMVNRVKAFLKVGKPRNRAETVKTLRSYFTEASKVDTKTKLAKARTETGVKDTYQMVFLDKLFSSYKHKRQHHRQAALDEKVAMMDIEKTLSPVWRIRGLDPHSDTPVEILHVVLLGFVKYLWRDVVQNQLKNQDQKKADLASRLSSFDVTGLGISPLAGQTLVQYAGSLTGRDFRAIAQAAPFVLYDLVSQDCFSTWVALSKLIPLIWQPEIRDVEAHIALLEKEINHFLLCAARWTVRWFNKPKFHLLLHLPDHIRRFGPAIIFATEVFESFNAVIRAKSIHSNRQAPSRDIARAFAQGNRIRHLLSGGLFVAVTESSETSESDHPADHSTDSPPRARFSFDRQSWQRVGSGPSGLVHTPNTVTQYLGLDSYMNQGRTIGGFCSLDDKPARPFSALVAANLLPHDKRWKNHETQRFRTAHELHLNNGDKCIPGSSYVILRLAGHTSTGETCVVRVEEIISVQGSPNALSSRPDFVVVQRIDVSRVADSYAMPLVTMSKQYAVVPLDTLLCTVNVQHNCAVHGCDLSAHRPVFQERVETQFTRAATAHRLPHDLVLNTAQMRDAVLLQKFRIASADLEMDSVVTASVAREINAEKTKRQQASAASVVPAVTSGPRASGVASGGERRQANPLLGRSLRIETLNRASYQDSAGSLGGSTVDAERSRTLQWIDNSQGTGTFSR
ncbi:hypothetical protein EUX98_g7617 [Antrodiella citrinella]|uniref:Uncharacterized protein n=1 Tax=Antrodiella citrinella TaxID=2447956 RepID=A0A4S4MNF4_9APHY|nr:hypothetical protein EUX98_g7617 [Antrodiella citrinella]